MDDERFLVERAFRAAIAAPLPIADDIVHDGNAVNCRQCAAYLDQCAALGAHVAALATLS